MNAYGSRTKSNRRSFSRRVDQDDQPRVRRASFRDRSLFIRVLKNEDGQMLPYMAFLIVATCGMAGLTLDLGRAYGCYRELQASTDAAALAGAYEMFQTTATSASVSSKVTAYSSATGGANANPNLPGVTVTTTLKCLSSVAALGAVCVGAPTGNNALQVRQTMAMPTLFIRALGAIGITTAQSLNISATATAAMKGGVNQQYNVAIVLDTTASMTSNDTDASCNNTRINCALSGVRSLMQLLAPCSPSTSGSGCPAFDQVSLFTYPNVQANTAGKNGTCPTTPTVMNYSLPGAGATWVPTNFTSTNATYQLVNFSNDYSSTYSQGGALSTTSQLAVDAGAKSGCAGLIAKGGVGTYFAGAIYAAQSSLIAAQAANPGSLNAMIILSDGDASSTKITGATSQKTTVVYGSQYNQCQQAIVAAQAATTAKTAVYSIAYGAANSGCSMDQGGPQQGISPCSTMQQLASVSANFYSDATASQNPGQCISGSNPSLTLNNIFQHVWENFTNARLLPDNAT
jgi:Putative Flp pilus-assembly TadE/G-like